MFVVDEGRRESAIRRVMIRGRVRRRLSGVRRAMVLGATFNRRISGTVLVADAILRQRATLHRAVQRLMLVGDGARAEATRRRLVIRSGMRRRWSSVRGTVILCAALDLCCAGVIIVVDSAFG
jgi:hypothetical protein